MTFPNVDISEYCTVQSITANANRGGWEARFSTLQDTDLVNPLQYIQLYWRGFFGTEETYGLIALQGHVVPVQFNFDQVGSVANFIVQTSDGFLREGWLQGVHFRDTDTVARQNYHTFDSITGVSPERMTLGRLVRHILGYHDELGSPPSTNPDWVAHTNMVYDEDENPHGWLDLSNVETDPFNAVSNPNGSMRMNRYIVRETNSLWNTIQQIAKNEFFVAYFTKLNELHYERHPMFSTPQPSVVMTFDENFCVGRPTVTERTDKIRQVVLHAVQDGGSTIHSEYPASPTFVYGNTDEQTYIRCNDQDTLDWWAEVKYGWLNRPYTVRWTAPGLAGLLFEINDPVYITYTGTTGNGVHIDWTDERFWITDINIQPNEGFSGQTIFTLEADFAMAT